MNATLSSVFEKKTLSNRVSPWINVVGPSAVR